MPAVQVATVRNVPPPELLTEKQWQRTVVEAFQVTGWRVYHTFDSRRSAAGFPDLCCIHPTHGLRFLELKAEKGRVSVAQSHWIAGLRAAGQCVDVLKPSDWERAQAIARGERPVTGIQEASR